MSETIAVNHPFGHKPVARLAQLDGLRGVAACGVAFLYHTQSLFAASSLADAPRLLLWFQAWGWTMVDLFFLISGYVFAHVYRGGGGLTREKLSEFAVARIARLYPLHLATLLVCAVLFSAVPSNTVLAFVAHLLMLQAFVQPVGHTFNGPAWSISVEIVCYVLFALGAVGGPRTLRWLTALAIVGAIVHFALQGRPGGPWVGDSLPRGLLGFFLGQVLWTVRASLARVPVIVLLFMFVLGLTLDMGRMSSLPPLCLLAWPALLVMVLRAPWMGSAPMRWLGDRSYAIYLVHLPILIVAQSLWARLHGDIASVWVAIAAFAAAVLVVSDFCYRLFEIPAQRAIKDAWQRRKQAAMPDPV